MTKARQTSVIICARRTARQAQTAEVAALETKTPTLAIPCAMGEHEDCGGSGCECPCHAP